jgi:hypothetical protein
MQFLSCLGNVPNSENSVKDDEQVEVDFVQIHCSILGTLADAGIVAGHWPRGCIVASLMLIAIFTWISFTGEEHRILLHHAAHR